MDKSSDPDIGFVNEVRGDRAFLELTVDTSQPLFEDYYAGQPGSYVKIPFYDRSIIGLISSIKMLDPGVREPSVKGTTPGGRKVAECLMVGTLLDSGRFERGVTNYPTVAQKVRMVKRSELSNIFSEFVGYDFSFSSPVQAEGQPAYVHADRFFGRPVAILGATGSGKSCTVATILQKTIRKYPDTHIVVLDLHGEYARAFPENVQVIEADKVELPYWMLNFEEFQDLTVDPNEFTAKNQVSILRDALLQARRVTDRKKSLGLADVLSVDSPIYFDLEDMLGMIRGYNIQMIQGTTGKVEKGPLYGVFDRFMIRFESKVRDPRFRFLFGNAGSPAEDTLASLLKNYLSIDNGKRMTVVDLSGVPSEAVGVVVAVVSRIVFEFNLWNPDRDKFPILMVYEEAHQYIPEKADSRFMTSAAAVERIAKEGRKHGIGSLVVSQRPKELSETVLAQCNAFVVMRLTNPEDQDYVRHLVPDTLAGMMDMLPSLPTGEALLVGDSVAMPTRVYIECPDPKPQSSDVEYARWWADGLKNIDVDRIVRRWRSGQKKD